MPFGISFRRKPTNAEIEEAEGQGQLSPAVFDESSRLQDVRRSLSRHGVPAEASLVIDGLYLGSAADAVDAEQLRRNGVVCVVNTADDFALQGMRVPGVAYHDLIVADCVDGEGEFQEERLLSIVACIDAVLGDAAAGRGAEDSAHRGDDKDGRDDGDVRDDDDVRADGGVRDDCDERDDGDERDGGAPGAGGDDAVDAAATGGPARERRPAVLVHCMRGRSRSTYAVLAFLVRSRGMSLAEAVLAVQRVRPIVGPHRHLRRQAVVMERRWRGEPSLESYREWPETGVSAYDRLSR